MNSEFTIAVHSLVFLANCPERMAVSEAIADNVVTHPARIRKVMSCLRNGGIVETREGARGGYRLTKEPSELSLADIYRLLAQGSIVPSWCSGDPQSDCLVRANMADVLSDIFCKAEKQVETYFSGITIAEVLEHIHRGEEVVQWQSH